MPLSRLKSQNHSYNTDFSGDVWLRRFSKLTCLATLFLIFAGAMVKSTDSGLAVPDWPLSYGMFFPPMVGGVFYEHGHRMVASMVGLMMLILAFWLKLKEPRRWVRHLGFWALGAVIVQGLLGGITVLYFLPTPVSVTHGVLAQIFFILTIIIAYSQSKERRKREYKRTESNKYFLRWLLVWIMFIFIQLILGAIMRHTESGLAIPDFPTMGGSWLPLFDQAMIDHINNWRFDHNYDYITRPQVIYHFMHRAGAVLIVALFFILNYFGLRYHSSDRKIKTTLIWLDCFVILQIILGISTVLSQKSPLITSAHVVLGAAILGLSVFLFLRSAPLTCQKIRMQIFSYDNE